jgi:hypothetical protein
MEEKKERRKAEITVAYRPLTGTLMAWLEVDSGYAEDGRTFQREIGEDITVEFLRVGPKHRRTGVIWSGLQVVSAADNPGWDAFLGIEANDAIASVLVKSLATLSALPAPEGLEFPASILVSHRETVTVDLEDLIVGRGRR